MRGADAWIRRGVWRRRSHRAYSDHRAKRFRRAGGCAQPGAPSVGFAGCVAFASYRRGVADRDGRTHSRRHV
jgi:hypothetical protein